MMSLFLNAECFAIKAFVDGVGESEVFIDEESSNMTINSYISHFQELTEYFEASDLRSKGEYEEVSILRQDIKRKENLKFPGLIVSFERKEKSKFPGLMIINRLYKFLYQRKFSTTSTNKDRSILNVIRW
jgi:site-specific recombinase XerD